MKATTIVLIAAAPVGLLIWLFSRRKPLKQIESSQRRPATAGIAAEENDAGALEVERASDLSSEEPPLRHAEEKPHEVIDEERQLEPPAALAAMEGHQSQSQAAAPAQEEVLESHPFAEAHPATQAAATGHSHPADLGHADSAPAVEILPEPEDTADDIGTSGVNGQPSTELPVDMPAAANATPREDLQPEPPGPPAEPAPTGIQPSNGQLTQMNGGAGQALPSEPAVDEFDSNIGKTPQRYRPPPQRPPGQAVRQPANREARTAAPLEVLLGISVQLRFDRSGFCEIALLPERTSGLDNEVAVTFGRTPLHLLAQEDWYEDLPSENVGKHLLQGLELKGTLADGRSARWLLTGRDLYVLANHPRASRFVSTNRMALGRSHVVLCRCELLQPVEAILKEAGCPEYTKLDESYGVPSGWVALRGVLPAKAIPLDSGTDPFYAVKPAPDIEIDFEGGLCLRNSVWLMGYPPRITLLGESNVAVKVLIDGKYAQPAADGSFIADDYDLAGQHSVYCEGASCSRSYSIEEPPESWKEWPAHHFGQADICGPLVRLKPEAADRRIFTVPMSNPVLLGAEPGQIFRCPRRNVARWKGYVPFDVVWALPVYPLIANRKTASIIQISDAPVVPRRNQTRGMLLWCSTILDASRKRLRIDNESPDSKSCWDEYKKVARNIWRAAR